MFEHFARHVKRGAVYAPLVALMVWPLTGAGEGLAGNGAASLLEEVVVVSSRVGQPVQELPAAVSVITRDDLQTGRLQLGLDEALNRVPGLFSQNRYNFAQDLRLSIRGFGARANFGIRGLKIIVDDIPATLADGQSGVDDIDLGSLARVEVTRGPSSAAYGASSGGVLNLISESGADASYLQGRVTAGEDALRKYQLKSAGRSGPLDYMVSLTDLTYDGFRDHARVESTLFNSKFNYDFGTRGDLSVVFNWVDSPVADDAGGITTAQAAADPSQAQARNVSSAAGEALDQQKLGLVYRRDWGNGHELRVRNYYLWRDFAAYLPIGTHIPFVADDGVVSFERFFYGGGLQLAVNAPLFGLDNQTVVGLDLDRQEDDRQRFLNNAGMRGSLTFDQLEEAQAVGVYVRNETQLDEAWSLILGARYDEVTLKVDDDYLANGDQSSRLEFDEFSPTVGLVWAPHAGLNVYANYATSFETPTFTELASPARNLDVSLGGFNNVDAQRARGFEVGVRTALWDSRLYMEAAFYSMDVEDEITSVGNIGNRSFFENADTERQGVEVTVQAALTETLALTLAYSHSAFEFERFAGNDALVGNDLPGLPKQQWFVELAYRHPSGFYLIVDALQVGALYANNTNSVKGDDYQVSNLRLGYEMQSGDWQFAPFVGVNNLFDETYFDNVRINAFGGRFFEPAPPRNVYAGFSINLMVP